MNDVYFRDRETELRTGDALAVMRSLSAVSVDCVVTSPPHWGLRDYGTAVWSGGDPDCLHSLGTTPHQRRVAKKRAAAGRYAAESKRCRKCGAFAHDPQYGLESTIEDYVQRIREVGEEVRRLLAAHGTFWLNLRDSYSYLTNGTGRTAGTASSGGSESKFWPVEHKSLFGLPWRVAFALQADGWIIRNAVIWHKPNSIPDPARDRLSQRYEMLFLLVKQTTYCFDTKPILQSYSQARPAHRKTHHGGNKPNTIKTPWTIEEGQGRNPGDVWSIPTRPLREAHCAAFPIDIPHRCIASGCPAGGTVLDPFSGAGTTGLAAHQLGRRYLGVDLRTDYHDIFLQRRRAMSADAG